VNKSTPKKTPAKGAKTTKSATTVKKVKEPKISKEAKEEAAAISDKKAPKPKARKSSVKKAAVSIEAAGETLAKLVAQGMFEKKAENIRILDMRKVKGASADYFVISHASNDKQVEAIANSAEDEVKKLTGESPISREGYENLEWILLDYFDVVAHVFQEEKRDFYGIEELWGDAVDVAFVGK
jgi:ribosome-associated protein